MPGSILGRGLRLINIRANHAIKITPADNEAHSYAALVDAFGIIGDPDDSISDAGVDAESAEEGACVSDAWRCTGMEMLAWVEDR